MPANFLPPFIHVYMSPQVRHSDIFPEYGKAFANPWSVKTRVLYKILPVHTLFPLKEELRMAWIRWKSRSVAKHYSGAKALLVNLGAGDKGKVGWVNVDSRPFPGINCVYDCRKQLPFPDGSVKGIFCEHFFEHLDYTEEVPYFLAECHRVLQSGGVLRIVVPDIERYLRAYCEAGWEALSKVRPLDSDQRDTYYHCRFDAKMELINLVFRQGGEHKYAYDYENLRLQLIKSDFTRVTKQSFGQSFLPEVCIDQADRVSESLYVESMR